MQECSRVLLRLLRICENLERLTPFSGTVVGPYTFPTSFQSQRESPNAINSEHYVDGSIDTAHIADDQITEALMADDAIGSAQLKTLSTLLIKDSAGSTLKTIHGAGA